MDLEKIKSLSFSALTLMALGLLMPLFHSRAAQALDLYNCDQALVKLAPLNEKSEFFYKTDLQKQVAELLILKTPLLFNPGHIEALLNAAHSLEIRSYTVIHEKDKDLATSKKLQLLASTTWANMVDFYLTDPRPDAAKALIVGITEMELLKLKTLVKIIDDNPLLKNATIALLKESAAKIWNEGKSSHSAKERRSFFEKLPGELNTPLDFDVHEQAPGSPGRSRSLPQKMTISLEGNGLDGTEKNMTLTREFAEGKSTTEHVNLVDLITREYPIFWSYSFAVIFSSHLQSMGITNQKFYRSFSEASREDLEAVSRSLWDRIEQTYRMGLAKNKAYNDFSEGDREIMQAKATELKISVEDFFQTRLLVDAIHQNSQIRETVIKIIRETLQESSKNATRNITLEKNLNKKRSVWKPFSTTPQWMADFTTLALPVVAGPLLVQEYIGWSHPFLGAGALAAPLFLNLTSRGAISAYHTVAGKTRDWLLKRQKAKLTDQAKKMTGTSSEE